MARSGGTYTAPSNSFNPAVEGETIDEAAWNETLDDLEAALTESTYTGGLGSTDNRLVRTDGTDTKKIQGTGITVDDSNNVTGVVGLSATTIELGHASDTTLARSGAGDVTIEGNAIYRAGGTDVAVADGGTGASTAAAAATNLGLGTGDSPQFTAINLGHASDTTISRTGAGDIAIEGNAVYRAGGTDVALADGGTGASLTDPNADRIMFWDDSAGEVTWLEVGAGIAISGTTITVSGAGTGDVVGPASSVDGELALFDSTTGKLLKRATTTGLLKGASGVLSAASAGTDYYAPGGTDVALADGGTGASLTDPNADRIMFWDDSAGGVTWLEVGSGLTLTGTTLTVAGAGTGDVVGPNSATDNAIVRFDTTTGKLIQDSAVTIDDTTGKLTGARFGNTGLKVEDTNASHLLTIAPGSDLTADRTLTVTTGDASRTLTLSADFTVSNSLTLAGTNSTTMTFPSTSATVLTTANTATITKGFTVTPNNISTGSFTVDPSLGNYQYVTNNGAYTITNPASDCAVDILVTNGASAGATTFTGFTVGTNTGSPLTTTNTNKFLVAIRRINSVSTYSIYALQ
jgi:hypothetical protein